MARAPITVGELQRAMRAGKLDVVYQPAVDLRTGHIVAVEALVRWHEPGRGVILPTEFVPLAEQAGAIIELTDLVLHAALKQAAMWSTARWDREALPVWVNLSAKELSDPELTARVEAAIAESGTHPDQLGIEVTETAPIDDLNRAVEALRTLRATGVRVALDDFGTGYSSLAHLRSLPVDVIKIDRSFVDGVVHSPEDAAIVAGIIDMAHALHRVVVAEGVEDSTQQRALDRLGCDLGQGYLFSSPQPAHCIDILLAADRELAAAPSKTRQAAIRLPRPRGVFADTPAGWPTLS
jgi:EAL domain-containing protein (putative c-di-GMP-specific phosphodiesterase class I)